MPITWPALEVRLPPDSEAAAARLDALLDDFQPSAVDQASADRRRIYFFTSAARDRACDAIRSALPRFGVSVRPIDVADEDWARRSQAALKAIRVGDLIVGPPWDIPHRQALGDRRWALGQHPFKGSGALRRRRPAAAQVRRTIWPGQSLAPSQHSSELAGPHPRSRCSSTRGLARRSSRRRSALVIVIEPSMGFGTGHHQSTRLCLRLMQRLDLRGTTVLDVGTGSGILAIAARQLGAETVLAIDTDADAIDSARRNLELNGLAGRIELRTADIRTLDVTAADLVLANLTGALLTAAAPSLTSKVRPKGWLIASGFTAGDAANVRAALGQTASIVAGQAEDEWGALLLQRR